MDVNVVLIVNEISPSMNPCILRGILDIFSGDV